MDWLQQMQGAEGELRSISNGIQWVESCLRNVGLKLPATKLKCLRLRLDEVAVIISKATNDKIHADYRQAQEASGNIMRACLAVASETKE